MSALPLLNSMRFPATGPHLTVFLQRPASILPPNPACIFGPEFDARFAEKFPLSPSSPSRCYCSAQLCFVLNSATILYLCMSACAVAFTGWLWRHGIGTGLGYLGARFSKKLAILLSPFSRDSVKFGNFSVQFAAESVALQNVPIPFFQSR